MEIEKKQQSLQVPNPLSKSTKPPANNQTGFQKPPASANTNLASKPPNNKSFRPKPFKPVKQINKTPQNSNSFVQLNSRSVVQLENGKRVQNQDARLPRQEESFVFTQSMSQRDQPEEIETEIRI